MVSKLDFQTQLYIKMKPQTKHGSLIPQHKINVLCVYKIHVVKSMSYFCSPFFQHSLNQFKPEPVFDHFP